MFVHVSSANTQVTYTDILLSPEKYVGKEVTMSGNFYYKHVERKSFDLQQEDYEIEVYYERLPKKTQAAILSQKNFSKTPVTVKGVLKRFSNAKNSYYIMATNVQGLAIEKKTGGGLHYTDILLSPEKYVGKRLP
jgi:hypothetical protein